MALEKEIEEFEKKLCLAMLRSDVEALDELLAPDLVFCSHLGQMMGKDDDLQAHRSGSVSIETLELSDQRIRTIENGAVVSVQAKISGNFGGVQASGVFRFLRVWAQKPSGTFHVIAAQSTQIA